MLVSHHAVQLETTICHKLCYKSFPVPILYRYHHKMPPLQQLPKKKFLKETVKRRKVNWTCSMMKKTTTTKTMENREGKGEGGKCFSSLCPVLDPVPHYVKGWHTG